MQFSRSIELLLLTFYVITNLSLKLFYSFLNSLFTTAGITSQIWIGLNDLTLQHSFDWTDDSTVDFTWWNSGEPNNYGDKGEDCVEMYGNVSIE